MYFADNALVGYPGNGPISGVTIELHASGSGTLLALVQTDGNGNYTLPNVPAGNYFLHELQPNGYQQGGIFPGNAGGSAAAVDLILSINLGAGVNGSGYNFSEIPNGGSTPTPSPTPAATTTPSPTPNTTTCLTNRPDLTMIEISNGTLASLLINHNGTFGDGTALINVSNYNGHTFDWLSNIAITSVFARTATGGALFEYNPPVLSVNGSGTVNSITFLSFCYSPQGGPTPTPTAPNNPTPTPTLPDTTVTSVNAANSSTGGALLAGALIVILAAALALGSGWRRNRKVARLEAMTAWSTGPRRR